MLRLHAVSKSRYEGRPFVARITKEPLRPMPLREREAIICCNPEDLRAPGFRCYLIRGHDQARLSDGRPGVGNCLELPHALTYLAEGDILRVEPATGRLHVLYRRCSDANTLLLTERCNNCCLMCSQPPRDDEGWVDEVLQTIKLMDPSTRELGISGGEPSLLEEGLLEVVRTARNYLPRTALHVLSNARAFKRLHFAQELATIAHPDLMVGVPLNSDLPEIHDYIAQAAGAFDETVLGLMNLKRCAVRVELRIVVHRLNVDRLVQIGRFITRNLAFCDHIAFMGMEVTGLARANRGLLWIDPYDYRDALRDAVLPMLAQRLSVSVFNLPLCNLDFEIWKCARKSISDWKVEYAPACGNCVVRDRCCGLFGTSHGYYSRAIQPIGAVPR